PNLELRMASHLTSRERECLMMLVEGLDTAAMVDLLGVSRTTVRTHLQSVLTNLGVHSRLEAVSFAVRHRLPDLWSGDSVPAAAPGPDKRAGSARMAPMRSLASRSVAAVRPIRPRPGLAGRADVGEIDLGERRALAVAAGQGASAG